MSSLRNRLLTSYLLLLTITLAAFTSAFLLAISTSPAPIQPTYQELGSYCRESIPPIWSLISA